MCWSRAWCFLASFVFVLLAFVVAGQASANQTVRTQADAYAACVAYGEQIKAGSAPGWTYSCVYDPVAGTSGGNSVCDGSSVLITNASYDLVNGVSGGVMVKWNWCVPSTCTAGTHPDGQSPYSFNDPGGALGAGAQASLGGCCAHVELQQSSWSQPDKSDAVTTGDFVLDGGYCYADLGHGESGAKIPKPAPLVPYDHCKAGVHSCYNPFNDNFCSQSDSGEWFCVPRKTPAPGGCISGATGSECLGKDGNPPPVPPDPPIKKGTPPDSTNNYTINDSSTTNNYTTNNYSGTSDGGSGSESGPPGSAPPSSSPGGSGTNTSGSGNSGKNGTDGNGKCSDGSVPTASGCSGTYRDDGCDTPPACHGDAVLCGIAANTHKTACAAASGSSTGSPPAGLDGDPTDNTGDPGSSAVSSSVDLGDATGNLDAGGFGYSSSCPVQDVSFSVFGQSVNIPLSDKCNLLSFLKYIVLALAYFTAAKIIAGVK